MNLWSNISRLGVYLFGMNVMMASFGSAFFGGEAMEELFPLMFLGGFGQQNTVNTINPYPIHPLKPVQPVVPLLPPPTQRPATPNPPAPKTPTISWRWVPNVRYLWQLPNNNQLPGSGPFPGNMMAGPAFPGNMMPTFPGNVMPGPSFPGSMLPSNVMLPAVPNTGSQTASVLPGNNKNVNNVSPQVMPPFNPARNSVLNVGNNKV